MPNWGTRATAIRENAYGPRARSAPMRHVPDPGRLDWRPRRGPSFSPNVLQDPYEAAHMPSRLLTEPMRCWGWSRVKRRLAPLSMRRRPASFAASPCGDRVRSFAWPARGTDRFLGRGLRHGRRRVAGTQPGLSPHSCLAPPRFCDAAVSQSETEMPLLNHAGAARVVRRLRKPFEGSG